MKSFIPFIAFLFSLVVSNDIRSQIIPKNYWESFSVTDGLVNDTVQDVLIEDKSNVWIATNAGLSHFDGTSFTNYTTSTSNLLDNDIQELLYAQNKIWMRTPSGLSGFDGTTFTNYTTVNGLLNNSFSGFASTSNDTIWLCSNSGTSKFDGVNFTHYPSVRGTAIAVDGSDRVYTGRVFGAPVAGLVSLYESGVWSNPTPTGIDSNNIVVTRILKTTKDGELFSSAFGEEQYYEISYPMHYNLKRVTLNPPGGLGNRADLSFMDKSAGKLWAGSSPNFLCTTRDSIARAFRVNNLNVTSTSLDLFQDLIVVGTTTGIYLASSTIEPTHDQAEEFSVNQITTNVSITDPLFSDVVNGAANFEYPKNSGNHGIYSANFIVAAKKQNQSTNIVHPEQWFAPSFSPGPINNTAGLSKDYLVKVSRQEILTHQNSFGQPTYVLPDGIKNWPAYGDTTLGIAKDLAPFVDANMNGCYDPENGDYPIIKGDEAIYWINHPDDQNLELEYHWMMYGFNAPNTTLDQSIFVQYTMINRSVSVYDSVKVGFILDPDLGSASDDYVGCDSLNDIMYAYNGSFVDPGQGGSPGYGSNTPALGVKFLSDPLTNLMYFNIGSGVTGDPTTNQDWINLMNSRWKSGQQLKYGGNGFNSLNTTNQNTTHMFTGDPYALTGWTELTANPGSTPNSSGDRRIFGSIPYFSLQPNERKTIEIAVGYGRTLDSAITQLGQNVSTMIDVLESADSLWNLIVLPTTSFATTDSCQRPTSLNNIRENQETLQVYPIPTSQELNITSSLGIAEIQLFDMKGAMQLSEFKNQLKVSLDLSALNDGIYLLRIRSADDKWNTRKVILSR